MTSLAEFSSIQLIVYPRFKQNISNLCCKEKKRIKQDKRRSTEGLNVLIHSSQTEKREIIIAKAFVMNLSI